MSLAGGCAGLRRGTCAAALFANENPAIVAGFREGQADEEDKRTPIV